MIQVHDCRKQREAARDDVSEALGMAEDELGFQPQAGATTSANAALTAAAMASAGHKRQKAIPPSGSSYRNDGIPSI